MACNLPNFQLFLSYNHKSKNIVENIHSKLKEKGYKIWIDYEQMITGDFLADKMTEGILRSELFLAFISEDYCKSKNCKRELKFADEKQKNIIYVVLQDLKTQQYENNNDIQSTFFLISDRLRFNAYKKDKTFVPWNEQLFFELENQINEILNELPQNNRMNPETAVNQKKISETVNESKSYT